jgi:3-hydroxymyristoyl/3-hydroxydecanoyl-(acyl carrier protein) dehydratase
LASVEIAIAEAHPATQGHFPGNPILPGAVLLSEVVQALGEALDLRLGTCEVVMAKFLAPVRPGDRVAVDAECGAALVRFTGRVGGRTVLTGQIRVPSPT